MKIYIEKGYKSLPKKFAINGLPDFVIITGENGSGKSQLLEYIGSNGTNDISVDAINFVPSDWKAVPNKLEKQKRLTYESQISNIKQKIVGYFRKREQSKPPNPDDQHERCLMEIASNLNKTIGELTEDDVSQHIPYDIQNRLLIEVDFIKLFIAYRDDYDSKCGDANERGDVVTLAMLRETKAPWTLINELFENYNFDYRLEKPPAKGHEFDSLYFHHYKNKSLKLILSDLSSGEQMIAMIIFWSHNTNTGKRCQLLLLDEPDAFLHPSMCKMLIEILSNKILKQYEIKIIMATHSPSTIAYAPEESIYLMQKAGERFQKESKASAINALSDGMCAFSLDDANENFSLLYNIRNSKKDTVILLEGKHDIPHISAAAEKLGKTIDFEMIPLDGADKLKNFILSMPEKLFGDKKIIALFDADEKGYNMIQGIKGTAQKEHSNCYVYRRNSYYMTLPVPHNNMEKLKNCPLEMLYPIDCLRKHNMIKKLELKQVNNKLESDKQLSSDQWDGLEEQWCFCLEDNANKESFATKAREFGKEEFKHFEILFNQFDFLKNLGLS